MSYINLKEDINTILDTNGNVVNLIKSEDDKLLFLNISPAVLMSGLNLGESFQIKYPNNSDINFCIHSSTGFVHYFHYFIYENGLWYHTELDVNATGGDFSWNIDSNNYLFYSDILEPEYLMDKTIASIREDNGTLRVYYADMNQSVPTAVEIQGYKGSTDTSGITVLCVFSDSYFYEVRLVGERVTFTRSIPSSVASVNRVTFNYGCKCIEGTYSLHTLDSRYTLSYTLNRIFDLGDFDDTCYTLYAAYSDQNFLRFVRKQDGYNLFVDFKDLGFDLPNVPYSIYYGSYPYDTYNYLVHVLNPFAFHGPYDDSDSYEIRSGTTVARYYRYISNSNLKQRFCNSNNAVRSMCVDVDEYTDFSTQDGNYNFYYKTRDHVYLTNYTSDIGMIIDTSSDITELKYGYTNSGNYYYTQTFDNPCIVVVPNRYYNSNAPGMFIFDTNGRKAYYHEQT